MVINVDKILNDCLSKFECLTTYEENLVEKVIVSMIGDNLVKFEYNEVIREVFPIKIIKFNNNREFGILGLEMKKDGVSTDLESNLFKIYSLIKINHVSLGSGMEINVLNNIITKFNSTDPSGFSNNRYSSIVSYFDLIGQRVYDEIVDKVNVEPGVVNPDNDYIKRLLDCVKVLRNKNKLLEDENILLREQLRKYSSLGESLDSFINELEKDLNIK